MIKINLANYRKLEQIARKKRLIILIIISICLAFIFNLFFYFYYQILDLRQVGRNNFLEQQIATLNNKLVTVGEFDSLLKDYKLRLSHYNQISNYSDGLVSLLATLNSVTPNQVYYQQIAYNQGVLSLHGIAKSPLYLSLLMDNLNQKYEMVKLNNSVLGSNNTTNFEIVAKNKTVVKNYE